MSNPKALKREILRKLLHCTNCNALAVGHLTQDIHEMMNGKSAPHIALVKISFSFLTDCKQKVESYYNKQPKNVYISKNEYDIYLDLLCPEDTSFVGRYTAGLRT